MARTLRVLRHVGFFLAICDVISTLGMGPVGVVLRESLMSIAAIAALSGCGAVASSSGAGATILFFIFLVLRLWSFTTRRFSATSNSNRMRQINWREYCAPRSGTPDGVSLRRSQPIAWNVRSRGQPVATRTNRSSPLAGVSWRASAANHPLASTSHPPRCWRHLNPRNPIR